MPSGVRRREDLPPGAAVTLGGRVAIVTGAASGIGRAIAGALARAGARVAVADLNEAGGLEAARQIEKDGGAAAAWRVDITDAAAVAAMVERVVARWGTVHILVNNAGWDRPIPFVETTPDFWDRILAINLRGPIACTHAVLPHMIRQEYGKIVSIASDAGRVGSTGEAVYSAAKGGIIAVTKTIAREGACHARPCRRRDPTRWRRPLRRRHRPSPRALRRAPDEPRGRFSPRCDPVADRGGHARVARDDPLRAPLRGGRPRLPRLRPRAPTHHGRRPRRLARRAAGAPGTGDRRGGSAARGRVHGRRGRRRGAGLAPRGRPGRHHRPARVGVVAPPAGQDPGALPLA